MDMYNATVEVARKIARQDEDYIDQTMSKLAAYHVAISQSTRGWMAATISLPAESLAQAASTAIAVVEAAAGEKAVACHVLTEEEFLIREGWDPLPLPELLSVSEAAELLGVSRQAVLQRIDAGTLPATRVGQKAWAISRTAVVPPSAAASAE